MHSKQGVDDLSLESKGFNFIVLIDCQIGRKISATEAGAADMYECLVCDFNTEILQHFKDHQANKHAVKVRHQKHFDRHLKQIIHITHNHKVY